MNTLPRRVRAAAVVLPILLVASSGCDIAMADFKQKATVEWHKTYDLQPGGHVEISNVNGKIDVQPSTGNTVDVTATKKARGATPEAAKAALERASIEQQRSPGGAMEDITDRAGVGVLDDTASALFADFRTTWSSE